jgi:hypothetical protein
VPTRRVPATTRHRTTIAGQKVTVEVPEYDEAVDAGWRAPVELTPAGRSVLYGAA